MQDIRSILILDDEPDFRSLVKSILSKQFSEDTLHEYDPLSTGAPGENFDWEQYDLLLLDHHLQLDNITGLDILHHNKGNDKFPITIMLTASDDEEIAFKALKLGISDFIRKQELTKQILFTAIEDATAKYKKKKLQQSNLKIIQKIFNKRYFYRALKKDIEKLNNINKRIIIGFRIEQANDSPNPMNAFIKDRVIRHIAKESCRFFMTMKQEPYITLFNEDMVAVLFDTSDANFKELDLIQNLHQLHLDLPYKNQDTQVKYDIVTSGLTLVEKTVTQADLINYFQSAYDKAQSNSDKSKRIIITSIQQLNQESKEAAPPIPPPAPKPVPESQQTEKESVLGIDLDLDSLDKKSNIIISAIEQNRLVKTYQPIIMLSGSDESFLYEHDIFYLSSCLIGMDDNQIDRQELLADITNEAVISYHDRWLLKETISNILDIKPDTNPSYFVLRLAASTLMDASFFNWLRKLLADSEQFSPGKYIILEIEQPVFVENEKQILALVNYLNHSHGFHFALTHITDPTTLPDLLSRLSIDILAIEHQRITDLGMVKVENSDNENYLSQLKNSGIHIIGDSIEDSNSLTMAIMAGADLAMGEFIGAARASFEEEDSIQSYEIESDEFVSSRM